MSNDYKIRKNLKVLSSPNAQWSISFTMQELQFTPVAKKQFHEKL
jgi:hypothetical protein